MQEENNKKSFSFKSYFVSIKEAYKYSFRIAPTESFLTLVLYLIYAVLPYATAWLLGMLVNNLIQVLDNNSGPEQINILLLFGVYASVSALPDLIASIRTYVEKSWRFKFQAYMEVEVLRKRAIIDIAHYEDPKFQDLYQRAFQRSYWPLLELADFQFDMFRGVVAIITGTILATSFNPYVYIILLVCSVPKFIAEYKHGFNVWSIWMKDTPEQRRFVDLRRHFIHRNNVIETKLIQSKNYLLNWVSKIMTEFNDKQLRAEKKKVFQLLASEIIALAGFVYAAFIILQDVLAGAVMVGSMVYILSTLSNVRNSFANTLTTVARQNERHYIVQDLLQFFNTKPLIKIQENPKKLFLKNPPTIKFENVSFKYRGSEKLTLQNINIELSSGKKIGLVGNNGAGKTTLIKLLCRIYDPTEGRILVNGTDLKDIDLEEWWSYLGVMLQDYNTYDFVVKEAIAIGRAEENLDLEKVEQSAKISQSSEFIEEWEKKYDESLGVEFGGKEPSKGQRQKLSIAKILYRNALIMILDEPTASVDAESEAKIFDSLDSLPNSMTAIFISHDFSTISMCDQIIVLDEGQVRELGNHEELIKLGGLYKKLYNLQAKRFK